ncbi:hypothetical protein VaNZ11_006378 [Volvox africanus]|uniref:Auxin efflux carrier n=1 Tax=Volvox africanus TaxID=51714 RepID=A0ABQ5S263_9CHLO|nr:hypothetical protein VaNZ11_006378 [Volvox africanus]
MPLVISEGYLPVVQTGLQTLCIIAAGRLAAARGLFDPAPVCRVLNRFVIVVCLPALQFWLLAIKTDMRNMEHWRAVGAFMLWTLLVQIGCTAWVLIFEGGKLSRICVHSLVLVANNTGILAPVVLEAAVGPSAAAVGMLATIVLYFQQLPVAMVLFELDRITERGRGGGSHSGAAAAPGGDTTVSLGCHSAYDCDKSALEKLGGGGRGHGGIRDGAVAWAEAAGAGWGAVPGRDSSGGGRSCSGGSDGSFFDSRAARNEVSLEELRPGAQPGLGVERQSQAASPFIATTSGAAPSVSSGDASTPELVSGTLLSSHRSAEVRIGSSPSARSSIARSVSQRVGTISSIPRGQSSGVPRHGSAGFSGSAGSRGGCGSEDGASAAAAAVVAGGKGPAWLAERRFGLRATSCNGTALSGAATGGRHMHFDNDVDIKPTIDATVIDADGGDGVAAGATAGAASPGTPTRFAIESARLRVVGCATGTAATPSPSGATILNTRSVLATPDVSNTYPQPRLLDAQPPSPHLHLHHHQHDEQHLHQRSHLSPQDTTSSAAVPDVCPAFTTVPAVAADGKAMAEASALAAAAKVASGNSSGVSVRSYSDEPSMRHAAQLVLGNVLMWTTGAATAVSMLGLHAVLDPDVPSHVRELGFVEGTLSWLARCSVPVSLFAIGLFTASRPGCGLRDAGSARALMAYLGLKLLLLPWLMIFVNSLLGLDGRLARSLVVLTCVPVGQNAFVVTEQFGEGAEAVTAVMQIGLLLMLPHVAGVMGVLRWMGLYQGPVA